MKLLENASCSTRGLLLLFSTGLTLSTSTCSFPLLILLDTLRCPTTFYISFPCDPFVHLQVLRISSFSRLPSQTPRTRSHVFMGSIRDLLNPLPEVTHGHIGFTMPASRSATTSPPYTEHLPRTKVAKDGAIFRPGPVRGQVRYPPHEERTRFLEEEHRKADLKPYGNIADFPRHIPYQSDKKTFRERTGRDSFHCEFILELFFLDELRY